jgi:hypothetical protein
MMPGPTIIIACLQRGQYAKKRIMISTIKKQIAMPAQEREVLYYNGKTFWLSTEPLKPLLNIIGDVDIGDEEPSSSEVVMLTTACYRGYLGTWKIVDVKLYLIGLEGYPG